MTLLEQQIEAINKLQNLKVGALFMEPGTGKTLTAKELYQSIPNIDYVLWLTPFQNKANLKKEVNQSENVDYIGIETLSNSSNVYLKIYNKLEAASKPVIIVDESIKIKNWDAQRTKRIINLSKLAEYKLILNGTPLTRNLLDLWSQFEFLSPKILNMNLNQFKKTFCEYVSIFKQKGSKSMHKEFIVQYHNIDYLYSLIKPYIYECNLKLDINKYYYDINYSLDPELKEEYNYFKNHYLNNERMEMLNNNIFLEMSQKMQRSYACSSEKFKLLKQIIKEPAKTIIYCKFTNSAEKCEEIFPNVKVNTYGKHSYGLNLQEYNTIIYFDKTFDYGQRLQSENRIFRTGQKESCNYYDLTGNVGLEKLINTNINKKQDLLKFFKMTTKEELNECL